MTKINPYIDINYVDRTKEVEDAFVPTLEDIKNDPEFYAELVTDLMYHWVYGTRETPLMNLARQNMLIGVGLPIEDVGPEYDSAGFTEEDRIVNGQYMNTEK
jgi:hypothetical protein